MVTRPQWDAFGIAAPGLAPLVADELTAIGIAVREVGTAGVAFDATTAELIDANLQSRIASRFIVRLDAFEARDFATLEKRAQRVPWAKVMRADTPVALRVTCRKSRLYHSDAVAERVARAIERSIGGAVVGGEKRATPDVVHDEDDDATDAQRIFVRFDRDVCTISADSSGALLHRRGWRQAIARAPLRETLAAAMLAACEWRGEVALVDPFCGAGTIGIEAALRARDMAPGLDREFVVQQWPGVDPAVMAAARTMARARILPSANVPIVISDRDEGAIAAAIANAERAGVRADLEIERRALSDVTLATYGAQGLLLTNPPYGVRVDDSGDLRALYARLGDVVRAGGRGWRAAMLVADKRLSGQVRITTETVLRTSNGGIGVTVEQTRSALRPETSPRASSSPAS